jgi:hypothetical protein
MYTKSMQTASRGKKPKQVKPKTNKQLDKILWKWFSLYVRLRDSDDNGYAQCITCGRTHHYKEMDAGHFISRRHLTTKFDPRNVNAQCVSCNKFNAGEQYKYSLAIDRKFGKNVAEHLSKLSSVLSKLDSAWYTYHIGFYKKLANDLLIKKSVLEKIKRGQHV